MGPISRWVKLLDVSCHINLNVRTNAECLQSGPGIIRPNDTESWSPFWFARQMKKNLSWLWTWTTFLKSLKNNHINHINHISYFGRQFIFQKFLCGRLWEWVIELMKLVLKKFLRSIKDPSRLVLLPAIPLKCYAQLRQFESKNEINIYFFSWNSP